MFHVYIYHIYIYITYIYITYIYMYIYHIYVYIGLSRLLELRKPEYDWGWGGVGC